MERRLFLFLWGRRHSEDAGKGAGMVLPIGLFLFPLEGLPCLRTSGSGQWMQSLTGMSVLRDGCLVPFRDSSPLTLPDVVTTFRVCLPRAPALRQVLEAMLAEGALESPSVLVLAFQLLFLVERSSDEFASGDRFLSPGRMSRSLRS